MSGRDGEQLVVVNLKIDEVEMLLDEWGGKLFGGVKNKCRESEK